MELKRVEPLRMRERIVDFFWRIRMWPYATKDEYYRFWDWRNSALSEVEPAAWIALQGDAIVGHISLYFRDLNLNGQKVRAGILANFRIDDAHGSGALAASLVGAPRVVVRRGELDLLTSYSAGSAHRLGVALGYHDLGGMQTFVRVLRWGPVVRRRTPRLLPMVPFIRAAARAHQVIRGGRAPDVPSFLVSRRLGPEEVRSLDLSHWRTQQLNWNGSLEYYANRFCPSEFSPGRVLGVEDTRTGTLEAVLAVTGSTRLTILQCDVNERVIPRSLAVEAALHAEPDIESVHIPMLPGSDLAAEFTKAGYVTLPARFEDPWITDRHWSGCWRPDHPLAPELAQTNCWNLWFGWTHH